MVTSTITLHKWQALDFFWEDLNPNLNPKP